MRPQDYWQDDPTFIEIGVHDAHLASSMAHEGFSNYLGVSTDARQLAKLQQQHPELANSFVFSNRERLVRNNNAKVLVLSGTKMLHLWKYRSVRHSESVAWRPGFNVATVVAFMGCLWHMLSRNYSRPRLVKFQTPSQRTVRLVVHRILRPRLCNRKSLHFIPHELGITGMFQAFDQQQVNYVVLRWFDRLPVVEEHEDVDLLVADDNLGQVLELLQKKPGIVPCDIYSETGLARSDYRGTPYYPHHVAGWLLEGRIRHNDLFYVPNRYNYFHSLAYHAVYHKGTRSNLDRGNTGLRARRGTPGHDYVSVLSEMAKKLQIEVDISLEGLHRYLQDTGWGPAPELLARLSLACKGNKWLRLLASRLAPHVHDQGLALFAIRHEAVQRGFKDKIISKIEQGGFEILAVKDLSPAEIEFSALRTRGGNWRTGPFDISGGPPAVAVVAYDPQPLKPNRKQYRKFPERTNARIFLKEKIRDEVIEELPANESFNAVHSSDHAAEAWHLLELYAPELIETVRGQLAGKHQAQGKQITERRAA